MKRSALSVALLYAACGFTVAGAVMLAPPLHADGEPSAPTVQTSISAPTFDLSVRYNAEAGKAELVATNTTDQPQTVEWSERVRSTGPISRLSRSMPSMKDVSTEPATVTPGARESKVIALDVPAAKEGEMRSITIEAAGHTIAVPMLALALKK